MVSQNIVDDSSISEYSRDWNAEYKKIKNTTGIMKAPKSLILYFHSVIKKIITMTHAKNDVISKPVVYGPWPVSMERRQIVIVWENRPIPNDTNEIDLTNGVR